MTYYSDPVSRLLGYGEPKNRDWPNYPDTFGFTEEHIPELIEMMSDEALNSGDPKTAEVWAPLHAWRTLGQLKAEQAVPALISMLERDTDDDWAFEEIPVVGGMIGEAAVEPAKALLNAPHENIFINVAAARCLEHIANRHPELKAECVGILVGLLQSYRNNDPELNGFIVNILVDLEAALEHIELIGAAYATRCVDEMILGDFEDLQVELGLLQERITPQPHYFLQKYPHMGKLIDALMPDGFAETERLSPNEKPVKKQKIGRNDPCPCGSGKKYKKCCMSSDAG